MLGFLKEPKLQNQMKVDYKLNAPSTEENATSTSEIPNSLVGNEKSMIYRFLIVN